MQIKSSLQILDKQISQLNLMFKKMLPDEAPCDLI